MASDNLDFSSQNNFSLAKGGWGGGGDGGGGARELQKEQNIIIINSSPVQFHDCVINHQIALASFYFSIKVDLIIIVLSEFIVSFARLFYQHK